MAENVAGSSVSTVSTVQSASSISSGAGKSSTTSLPTDSFKLLVRVSNSSGLSGVEKNGLIRDIAYADRFAMPKYQHVRKEMMNNIASTASFLENRSAHNAQASAQRADRSLEIQRAFSRYNQVARTAPKVSKSPDVATKQAQQTKAAVERSSVVMTKKPIAEVAQSVPKAAVSKVFNEDVAAVAKSVTQSTPQVQVKIPSDAKSVDVSFVTPQQKKSVEPTQVTKSEIPIPELKLPGSGSVPQDDIVMLGSGDYEPVPLPGSGSADVAELKPLGSGDSTEFMELNLPGSGSGEDFVALNLPGSGSAEGSRVESQQERIARLESLGVLNLDAAGASRVTEDLGQSIERQPSLALGAVREIPLPGALLGDSSDGVDGDQAPLSAGV